MVTGKASLVNIKQQKKKQLRKNNCYNFSVPPLSGYSDFHTNTVFLHLCILSVFSVQSDPDEKPASSSCWKADNLLFITDVW